jgi:hypothetical protein
MKNVNILAEIGGNPFILGLSAVYTFHVLHSPATNLPHFAYNSALLLLLLPYFIL